MIRELLATIIVTCIVFLLVSVCATCVQNLVQRVLLSLSFYVIGKE